MFYRCCLIFDGDVKPHLLTLELEELYGGYNCRAPWKNRIFSATMKLRKSLVQPVMRQETWNNYFIELFGSSGRDRYARRI